MECVICTNKKYGSFQSPCGHSFCGKCFLRLHCDAALELHIDISARSKCPFCRQVLGFEEEDYQKLREAKLSTDFKLRRLSLRIKESTASLRRLNVWVSRMSRLKKQLYCQLNDKTNSNDFLHCR